MPEIIRRLLRSIRKPTPMFLVVRDFKVVVGAYWRGSDARSDCAELNEDAMFSGQPRRYEVVHRKIFWNV